MKEEQKEEVVEEEVEEEPEEERDMEGSLNPDGRGGGEEEGLDPRWRGSFLSS